MMYRALVVGLLGAIALLVAAPREQAPPPPSGRVPMVMPAFHGSPRDVTVVDVSLAHAGGDLMPFLGLEPGERLLVADGAGVVESRKLNQRWHETFPGDYIDVGVLSPGGEERRILVLVHP